MEGALRQPDSPHDMKQGAKEVIRLPREILEERFQLQGEGGYLKVEDKLALNKFEIDKEVHIQVGEKLCQGCDLKPCLYVCPAECYQLRESHMTFAYEGCLECGSCRPACDRQAIRWVYRRGGSASVINTVEGGKMEIIVCVKPVLDPDLPPVKFAVDPKNNRVIPPEGMPPVMNPYDALAVEAALRIKEAKKAGKVTVLTVGDAGADSVIRKALAMGADEALVLSDPAFADSDGFGTARILAQAIPKVGKYDLILCGRQAADWDQGIVGSALAEFLGVPVVTRAKAVEAVDGKVKVDRVVANGFETFEVALPALITVSSEVGQARIPSGWGIIKAAKKPIPAWGASQVGADPAAVGKVGARNSLVKLFIPSYQRKCEMVTGETPAEAAAKLAEKIAGFKA